MKEGTVTLSLNELYEEINKHLVSDSIPSIYLSQVIERPEMKQPPFHLLFLLSATEQSPIHHPEGSVWNHTLMVVDEAAKRKNQCKNPAVFMWAALLHDIGKPSTTKTHKGKITSYNHDKEGAILARQFLSEFTKDKFFIESVCTFIKFHMHILYVTKKLPYADIPALIEKTDINEIALFGLCDRLGRKNASKEEEEHIIKQFIRRCKAKERRSHYGKSRYETT